MRGGFSSAFSSMQDVANNTIRRDSKDVSSIIETDANNLHGGIMLLYPLPLKGFELVEIISLDEIFQTEDEGFSVSSFKSIWSTLTNCMINLQTIHLKQTRNQSVSQN